MSMSQNYPENVAKLTRLIAGWYTDMNNGSEFVKNNMKIMVECYSDDYRIVAYAIMVKFNPTLRDMVGILSHDKFFVLVANLITANLTALTYEKNLPYLV